ncbi:uncharacterized protein LY89DRAFT_672938 [Mollisia scopiformis]|uniref:Uncharacterized protein n=1 Tax=Mollisia scopiformis TaxID=149040 RepID=A0A194WY12_MOLSC|nr:uncharacterized protein LY89DRAFT_672938 [Mollisia scopiformis]KUJ12815.1 hypothetical protein LY89DRAFT_672938 [Mollisia scopiformis]
MKAKTPRQTARFSPYAISSQPLYQLSSQLSPEHQDEEYTAPTGNATPDSSQSLSDSYQFDFSKHKGRLRPTLKAALAARASSQPTPSKSGLARAILTPLSLSNLQSSGPLDKYELPSRPREHVLPFGKFKGTKLKDVDGTYLQWVAEQICEGAMTLGPTLTNALTSMGYTTSYNSDLAPLKADYPYPDLRTAPTVFREGGHEDIFWSRITIEEAIVEAEVGKEVRQTADKHKLKFDVPTRIGLCVLFRRAYRALFRDGIVSFHP